MGVTRRIVSPGNKTDKPKAGDDVTIEYTGNLFDESAKAPDHRGKKFDSSIGRGDFKTKIGVGQVIKGWDEGVMEMSLGERAILTISGDYAYGERGFPNLIPPNSSLVFEVHLKGINGQKI